MRIFSVDIGGTNIKAGLLDEAGNIHDYVEHPTPESGGPEAVASTILFIKDNIFGSDCAIDGVGVGVAGPVDSDGVVYSPPNFRGWGIIDLKSLLAELLEYPPSRIFVGNDASLAALAELFIVNAEGKVLYRHIGFNPGDEKIIHEKIEQVINQGKGSHTASITVGVIGSE